MRFDDSDRAVHGPDDRPADVAVLGVERRPVEGDRVAGRDDRAVGGSARLYRKACQSASRRERRAVRRGEPSGRIQNTADPSRAWGPEYRTAAGRHGRGGPNTGLRRPPHERGGPNTGLRRARHGRGGPNTELRRPHHDRGGPNTELRRPPHERGGPNTELRRVRHGRGGPNTELRRVPHGRWGAEYRAAARSARPVTGRKPTASAFRTAADVASDACRIPAFAWRNAKKAFRTEIRHCHVAKKQRETASRTEIREDSRCRGRRTSVVGAETGLGLAVTCGIVRDQGAWIPPLAPYTRPNPA